MADGAFRVGVLDLPPASRRLERATALGEAEEQRARACRAMTRVARGAAREIGAVRAGEAAQERAPADRR